MMNDDLIKRSDAIAEIYKVRTPDVASHHYAELFINAVCRAPSADRPQGEWEYHSNPAFGINPEDAFCPHCKYHIDTTMVDFDDYNFCPNCGARMKGADDED